MGPCWDVKRAAADYVTSGDVGYHYDPTTSTLHVEFSNGAVYRVDDVPIDKAEAFTGSASPGSFYNSKIRSNHVAVKVTG